MRGICLSATAVMFITLASSAPALGKGLDSIAPEGDAGAKGGESTEESTTSTSGQAAVSATGAQPTRAIELATSFGWAGISKDSESWRAGGMSDLLVAYRLPIKVIGEALYATFRYAPMDVSPVIEDGGADYAYTGVVEGYHFGGAVVLRLKDRLTAKGTAELGYMRATLHDALDIPSHDTPDASGVNVTLGGGADWQLVPGFDVGPRLYLGFGSFTAFQFGASGTFAF